MNDKRYKDGKTIKQTLDNYLKAMGVDQKVKETDVLENWPKIMGDAVAKRTKKISIRKEILYVELSSAVMRVELLQKKSIIIQKMNDFAGFELIKDIYLK